MMKILNFKNDVSTSEVLELAKKFPICNDCSTGSHVINAGEKLVRKNKVKKELTENGFVWSLK